MFKSDRLSWIGCSGHTGELEHHSSNGRKAYIANKEQCQRSFFFLKVLLVSLSANDMDVDV